MKTMMILGQNGTFLPPDTPDPFLAETLGIIKGESTTGSSTSNYMKSMAQMELADYEPSSDKGQFRLYPKGCLITALIRDFLEEQIAKEFQAFEIITPFLYKWHRPGLKSQALPFEKKIYRVQGDEDMALRFNADVGLFEMLGALVSMDQLPLRFYEAARSFRNLQSGEVAGLSHGKTFLLLDQHAICANWQQALDEYRRLYAIERKLCHDFGFRTVTHFRVPKFVLPQVEMLLKDLVREDPYPAIVELLPKQKYYWMMKHALFTEFGDRLFHIQLDKESMLHYNSGLSGETASENNCVILHNSLATTERWMTLFLMQAFKKQVPVLPLWLSPLQVRFLPVNEKHLEFCVKASEHLKAANIRADVDDRPNSVGWKIRAAEREWLPYIVVCGDKEVGGAELGVRVRGSSDKAHSLSSLIQSIKIETEGMPFRSLPGLLVSKRPVFRGRD